MISMVWLARDMVIRARNFFTWRIMVVISLFALLDTITVVVGEWNGVAGSFEG